MKKKQGKERDALKSRFVDLYVETLHRPRVHIFVIKYVSV